MQQHGGLLRRNPKGKAPAAERPYLERACIDFYTQSVDEKVMINAFNLFDDLRHVSSLELSPRFIEVVSMMATNGRKIPQLKVKDLQVYGVDDAHNLHGVVAMLESCPYTEKLVMFSASSYWPKEEVDWGVIRRDNLNCDLMHLKLDKFEGLLGSSNSAAIRLLQILLSRAPSLEKVMYITRRSRVGCKPCNDIERILMSFPRSSPHASFEIL